MKKFSYAILLAIMFVACNQSPEKKAEALIKDDLKKLLYKPETYKPVETKVDTAFAPYDNPALFEEMSALIKLSSEFSELNEEMKNAKSSMAIWGDGRSAFDKNCYQEAVDKYNMANASFEKLVVKGKKIKENLFSMLQGEKQFIGYKAFHNYRADNNAGNTLIGNMVYFIDKDFKEIQYALELEEYNKLHDYIGRFVDEYLSEEEK